MPRPRTSPEPKTTLCVQVAESTKRKYYELFNLFQLLVRRGKISLPWKRLVEAITHDDFMRFILLVTEEELRQLEDEGGEGILY